MLEKILDKLLSFIGIRKIEEEKSLWKMKAENPKKYWLLKLEEILSNISWHEHILDKTKSWEWRKIQIEWWRTIEVKALTEEELNILLASINQIWKELKQWHKEYKILNKCDKKTQNAYWDFYNFFEKDRTQINHEDAIKFILRRKILLEAIWKELEKEK